MRREIVVNARSREKRVAIVEDGRLVELMYERPDRRRIVGDIYLGVVEAVVPGLQAAFIDIGHEKSGFLHASDLQPDEDDDDDGNGGGNGSGGRGRGRGRRRDRSYPPIQDVISKGETLVVQVTKEPIGTKGARVTTQVSLPGRFLVYIPHSSHVGISRKIEDRDERARLRKLVRDVLGDGDGGVIVRTVGEELTKKTFEAELKTLRKAWEKAQRRAQGMKAPALVYQDARLTSGIIRDVFNDRVDLLTVDSPELHHEIKSYLGQVDPESLDRVKLYEGDAPIFDEYGIEEEIRRAFRRKVDLPSGGHVVIEQTEALVSIDVNTGRYTGKKDPAQTILRTNMDAAVEIARQLRLRDVGGIIVIDFIDMDEEEHRTRVERQMKTQLGRDRARTKVFGISELGLLQMSRQRVSPSLHQRLMEPCPYCEGTGTILTPDTVVRRIERGLHRVRTEGKERGITILTHPVVALHLLENEREFLETQSDAAGIPLDVRDSPLLGLDEFRFLAHPADADVTSKYVLS
ncbi:MAG: Rne/Rng family ribonuclease [Gemmatimonadota bacterium]|nr:Rne/Rng family ribonuclease [Gemmatimonadota bacterium]